MRAPPAVLLLALGASLLACGGEPAPRSDASTDLPDARAPGCVTDLQCDDGVACTLDACRSGRCVREPTSSRCPMGSACDVTRGCLPRRPCAADRDCADSDICTVRERCDMTSRYCVYDELPPETPCARDGTGRVCRGGMCACPAERPMICNGLCVDTATDPLHCGACGTTCSAGSWCFNGRCACSMPQSYCPRAGCTDLSIDTANCGACGNICPPPGTCMGGRCVQPCPPATHRCGAACASDTSASSCGMRCDPCPAPMNGTALCMGAGPAATCSFACNEGFHVCGSRCVSNNDLATCGMRCSPCPTPENGTVACVSGACRVTCGAGFHQCEDTCASDSAVATCGTRCSPCPPTPNGTSTCAAGRCDFTCNAGFRRCGDICSDGTSPLGCGPSCTRCAVPENGVATCAAGACGFTCDAGFHACGNECRSNTSPQSCGTRCEPCPAPTGAVATCVDGICGVQCAPGFTAVDGVCREQPRLRWPPSTSHVTTRRPMFRWNLPMDIGMGETATLEVCRDRACAMVVTTLPGGTRMGAPTADLPTGNLFWRVRVGTLSSPVWMFTVEGRPMPTSAITGVWGSTPDFDGDGFAEVIASAPLLGTPGPRVYIHRGTSTGTTPLNRLVYDAPEPAPVGATPSQYGWQATSVGDLDGNGYADFAVGAPGLMNGTGRVYVYYASARGLSGDANTILSGMDGPMAQFGAALSHAGDLNADGYGDLVVGAPNASGAGRAYVYYGTARGVAPSPSLVLTGPGMSGARFGVSVTGAGDVDGDGDGDLLVGAEGFASSAGRAFVYTGGPMGVTNTPAVVLQNVGGGLFGLAVAALGDVNGDGYADVAVSAPAIRSGTGLVQVYHGSATGIPAEPSLLIHGPDGMDGDFGTTLVGGGDVDGDGFNDVVASAPRYNGFAGRVYVFRGGAAGVSAMSSQRFTGTLTMIGATMIGDYLGGALGAGRDIDNDGFADVVVGADRAMMYVGAITILRGSSSGLGRPTVLAGPEGPGNRFGLYVAHSDTVCRQPTDG